MGILISLIQNSFKQWCSNINLVSGLIHSYDVTLTFNLLKTQLYSFGKTMVKLCSESTAFFRCLKWPDYGPFWCSFRKVNKLAILRFRNMLLCKRKCKIEPHAATLLECRNLNSNLKYYVRSLRLLTVCYFVGKTIAQSET